MSSLDDFRMSKTRKMSANANAAELQGTSK